ncbi:hypothetical protein EV688_103188 [Chromatocurvus halotolerans]|uniref:Uncharacterized protein n=1 Tax=Chromatocurvus halotolerans TaxID=1132028 RepID=A0A4R2KTQ7_9GAMM|nr:hypothetical protein EV688_103188 [Chromatocurvus halotolerans]
MPCFTGCGALFPVWRGGAGRWAARVAAAGTMTAAAQLDRNRCAIAGTRTVLAETPAIVPAATRDLIGRSTAPPPPDLTPARWIRIRCASLPWQATPTSAHAAPHCTVSGVSRRPPFPADRLRPGRPQPSPHGWDFGESAGKGGRRETPGSERKIPGRARERAAAGRKNTRELRPSPNRV